ncbi:entericidin A/B family lipoprotein [Rhodopila sp.]|uniref:entericidin A/B family lipoprotein n=1 Tax=Rhodopila sp. TaxID=2480087 RepID=UPI003D0A92F0
MGTKARLALTIAALMAAAPLLTACYTTQGAGEDLSAAGKGISNTADHATGYKP